MSQVFRREGDNFGGGKEKTVMVERKFDSLQREIFNFSPTSNIIKVRCIITRLGSELSRPGNSGAMVHGETKVSHKYLGARYNVLHIKEKGCNISSHPQEQHDTPVILNEWGYQKPRADCDQQINLAMSFETKDHDYCQILTRANSCRGRQRIQANQGFQGMKSKLYHLQEIVSDKGNTRDGFVCLERVTPTTPIHVLEN